jgi:hypothetical protein
MLEYVSQHLMSIFERQLATFDGYFSTCCRAYLIAHWCYCVSEAAPFTADQVVLAYAALQRVDCMVGAAQTQGNFPTIGIIQNGTKTNITLAHSGIRIRSLITAW